MTAVNPCKSCRHAQWRQDIEAMYCHHPDLSALAGSGKRIPTFTGALRGTSAYFDLPNCGPTGKYWEGK